MKTIITTILLVTSILYTSQAQEIDRSNHTLLWEITGNDFENPSYLFGSMHVEDERVFEFSDSMLVCFENCEGFSSELNMDSMMHFIMSEIFSGDTTNVLKDLLSAEAYEGLNNKLMSKSGKSIDDLGNKQPWMIEMLLDDDPEESDTDYEAFLDLFLYNYAKKRGKETYGLEKIEDQLSLSLLQYQTYEEYLSDSLFQNEGSPEAMEKELESLKEIYLSGDINVIDEVYVKPMPNDIYKQKLLTDRNIVMADNIEKFGNQIPMFNVVGAAHLPGDMGVIDILRKRGYQVRAVTAEFTGKNQLMDVSDVVLPWHTLDLKKKMECTLEFPIDAIQFKEYGGTDLSHLDFYFSMDIGTQEVFSFLGIKNPNNLSEEEAGKTLGEGLGKMFEENEGLDADIIEDPIDVEHDGLKGKEIKGTTKDGGTFIGRGFIQNDKVYYLYVIREKGELENADRFFNSLKIFPTLQGVVKGEVVLENFALSFETTTDLKHVIKESPSSTAGKIFEIHQYSGTNKEGTASYIVQAYDMYQGSYLKNMDSVVERIKKNYEAKGAENVELGKRVKINQVYKQNLFLKLNEIYFDANFYIRGNRVMVVTIVGETAEHTKKESAVFNGSLKFIDFEKTTLIKNDASQFGVKISMPLKTELVETTSRSEFPNINSQQLICSDKNTSAAYVFEIMEISPYFELEKADTFLLGLKDAIAGTYDEEINSELKTYKGYPTIDVVLANENSDAITEMRICLVDNWTYSAYIHMPAELAQGDYAQNYFNSMEIDTEFKRISLLDSKSESILKDITSTDAKIFKLAKDGLNYHEFSNDDLPLIYEALEHGIPLDTYSEEYYNVKEVLLKEFFLINDEKTIPFLKKLFLKSKTEEKIDIVNIIGTIEGDSYNTYWELINQIDFSDGDYNTYKSVKHFSNEANIINNIAELMKLSKNEYLAPDIYSLFRPLVYQDTLDWEPVFKPYQKEILNLLDEKFNAWSNNNDDVGIYWLQNMIQLSNGFSDNKALVDFAEKNISVSKSYLFLDLANVLLENNIPLEKEYWERLDQEYLLDAVIENLSDENYRYSDIEIIPKKYKNQKVAAKLGMIMGFEYDYIIGYIELIKIEKIVKNKKSFNRYIYKMKRKGNDDDQIIGVAIYPFNKKEYSLDPVFYDYGSFDKSEKTLDEYVEFLMEYFEGE